MGLPNDDCTPLLTELGLMDPNLRKLSVQISTTIIMIVTKQAMAELSQAQVKPEVIDKVIVKVEVEVGVGLDVDSDIHHFCPGGRMGGWRLSKNKAKLNSS